MGSTNNVVYEFGPFRVAPARRLLLREGEPAAITARVFDLLVTLVEREGQVVTKDELIDIVWQGAAVEENNLTVCMTALRKALGETPPHCQYIITHAGVGYQFVAEVRKSTARAALPPSDGAGAQPHKGGAVPIGSKYYIVRAADHEFEAAVAAGDSIVLVKGSRQVG